MSDRYDLVIVGGGTGGLVSALIAARYASSRARALTRPILTVVRLLDRPR